MSDFAKMPGFRGVNGCGNKRKKSYLHVTPDTLVLVAYAIRMNFGGVHGPSSQSEEGATIKTLARAENGPASEQDLRGRYAYWHIWAEM